ncbi:TadE/TadG family type IV pilus assembly protein [Achromobacter marplatensis]|uniref:TadE/TadG family type IV pilus assembly protein n=1 Tax=Achromobacter marplatensis TaxID=470868 RepID=UPI0039F6A4EA
MTAFFFTSPRQRGAAAIEFTVAGTVVLLLGLLAIDVARWQAVRQMAHLALIEAARAGSTTHGDPARMRLAFQHALLPLHAGADDDARKTRAWRRQERAQASIAALSGLTPWRIEILQPDARAFREHGRAGLVVTAAPGMRAIDNDYQDLQHARRPAQPGGMSIFEANTLKLRLTYLHRPWLPPVRALLGVMGRDDASYAGVARAHGLLPIKVELEIEMHSHPVDWTNKTPWPVGMVVGACHDTRCR